MKFLFGLIFTVAAIVGSTAQPASFAYVLQADALSKSKAGAVQKLTGCGRDWIVIDPAFEQENLWTPSELSAIRAGRQNRKVIAYLSIGEAEDYRTYWRREWDANHDGKPDAGAPAFLLGENPEWKGNYRVKYWQTNWQQIILAEVDRTLLAGFDGVYLDIVDAFETFERDGKNFVDDRINPETGQSYRRDMVDWVKTIAARARKINPAAMIIPQNGTQLLAHPDFLATVDAVGVEDLFANGNKLQPAEETTNVLNFLNPMVAAHKPVLVIEYAQRANLQKTVREKIAERRFVGLITDRQLKTLGKPVAQDSKP